SAFSAAVISRRSGPSRASTRRDIGTGTPAAKSRLSISAGRRPSSGSGSASGVCALPLVYSLSIAVSVSILPLLPTPPSQIVHAASRLRNRRHRERERNGPEALGLPGPQDAEPDQLEQREERDDHLGPRHLAREERRELHALCGREPREDALDRLPDRHLLP